MIRVLFYVLSWWIVVDFTHILQCNFTDTEVIIRLASASESTLIIIDE